MKTCQFCGFRSKTWMRHDRHGWFCVAEICCYNRVLARMQAAESLVKRMRDVGGKMANACYNMAQRTTVSLQDSESLDALRRAWDETSR